MLKIDVRNVINAVIQQELIRKDWEGNDNQALYFNLDLRMSYYTDTKTYDQSRGLHLLYYSIPHMTNVSVFSGISASPFGKLRDIVDWTHEITHDTCWREVNIFSQVYFDMAEGINIALEKDHYNRRAPKDMHEWHGFHGYLFTFVPVKVSKDPTDPNSYKRTVKVL